MTEVQQKVNKFFSRFPSKKYIKGEVIYSPTAESGYVRYIESGFVIEYDIHDSGARSIVNTIKKGAFFPLVEVVSDIRTDFFFEAGSDLVVREATVVEMNKFLDANPDVTRDALARVLRGSEGLMRRLSWAQNNNVRGRILAELEIQSLRFGTERDGHVEIPITIKELAERVGIARETASRELSKMRASGEIETDSGVIRLF